MEQIAAATRKQSAASQEVARGVEIIARKAEENAGASANSHGAVARSLELTSALKDSIASLRA